MKPLPGTLGNRNKQNSFPPSNCETVNFCCSRNDSMFSIYVPHHSLIYDIPGDNKDIILVLLYAFIVLTGCHVQRWLYRGYSQGEKCCEMCQQNALKAAFSCGSLILLWSNGATWSNRRRHYWVLHFSEQVNTINRSHTGSDKVVLYITSRDRDAKHNILFLEIGHINFDCGTYAQNSP